MLGPPANTPAPPRSPGAREGAAAVNEAPVDAQGSRGAGRGPRGHADERLERLRKKRLALDVKSLTAPGYQHPARQMQRMRDKAEAAGMAEEY